MLSRRAFLQRCRDISLLLCGSTLLSRSLAEGFLKLAAAPPRIAFIHGQNCMGCTVSMMYGNDFDFLDFLSHFARLDAHPSLAFRQGRDYLESLDRLAAAGDYLLVVEGSIPTRPREACYLGPRPLADALAHYAARARLVIAAGTCASHGGIPASGGNLTATLSASTYLQQNRVNTPLLILPGCPVHPDHLMGSIAYFAATGKLPPLKKESQLPEEYFGELLHNRCSRHQHFSQDRFVENFASDKETCLLKKGCRGPITASDCPLRRWNQHTSVCVDSNTPCIGCMNSKWPFASDLYLETATVEDLPWSRMKTKIRQRGE